MEDLYAVIIIEHGSTRRRRFSRVTKRKAYWCLDTKAGANRSTPNARPPRRSRGPLLRALAIEERALGPILPAHRLPTQPTPPMRRPIKGWGGRAGCLHRRTGGAEPYMLAQDACIDLRSKAYRVPPVAAGLRDASVAMAESARGRSQARESHWYRHATRGNPSHMLLH